MQTFKLFVSSPGDVMIERRRVENVVSRLNGEFAGVARLEAIRWETEFYQAFSTFQAQIPRSTECDLVIGILKWRLGSELPPDFAEKLSDGRPFPSGTAYELLTAVEQRRKGGRLPDIYVFRFAAASPSVAIEDPDRERIEREWQVLKGFFQEWFLTAQGHFRAAFNPYRSEDDFEAQLEKLLRKWVADKVAGGRAVRWPIAVKGSPFRGLAAFGAKHAPVFFGRSEDTARALDLWRDAGQRGSPYLLIVGASGSGKSSLVRAGLIPRLTTAGVIKDVDAWRVAVIRPGDSPGGLFAALAAALMQDDAGLAKEEEGRGPALPEIALGDSKTPAELAALLRHADAAAVKPIVNALARVGAAERDRERYGREVRCDLVLLIDQMEELFAASVSDSERVDFVNLIASLVASGRVWVTATLRADFYASMLVQPGLKKLKEAGATYDLAPPGPVELAEIVRGPAEAAGLIFGTDAASGERLDARLLRDADRPDMLPLVQLALSRVFEGRESIGGETVLPLKMYEGLGGLKGIIDGAGETALASLGEAEKARLPRLLRQLAVPSHDQEGAGTSALTIRSVPSAQAAPDAAARKLLDALVTARLLTTSGVEADAQVRLAHQRVLEDWARARAIVSESADFYRIRADLEESRRKWDAGKRRGELLLARGLPLAEAESIVAKYGDEFSPEVLAYVRASQLRAKRAQIIGWSAAAVFFLLAILAGVAAKVAFDQRTAAEAARTQAQQEKERADRNFAAAKRTVDALIFDIAQGLREVAGMRVETTRRILGTVQTTTDQLVLAAPDDPQLQRSRSAMFNNFAETYLAAGDLQSALAAATKGLEIARELAARDPGNAVAQRDVSVSLERLGDVKLRAGDGAGALAAYREELEIARKRAAQDPNDAQAQRDIAVSLSKLAGISLQAGDVAGALASFQEDLDIARKLAARDPSDARAQRDLAVSLGLIGDVKLLTGDGTGALAAYRESLDIRRKLAQADPGDAQAQRDLSIILERLGDVMLRVGDGVGALAAYQESLDISRKLAALDPGNAEALRAVSVSLSKLGNIKLRAGDRAGALAAYQEDLDLSRKLAALDPGNAEAQRDLSVSVIKIGDVKLSAGDMAGAFAAYQEALDIRRRLAAHDPGNAQAQRDVTVSLERLGDAKLAAHDGSGALAAYRESLEVRRKLVAQDPGNAQAQRDLLVAMNKAGDVNRSIGDAAAALAAYQEGLEIARRLAARDPSSVQAQTDVIVSLYNASRVSDAVEARRALTEALAILEKLEREGKLAAAQKNWPDLVRASLAKLP